MASRHESAGEHVLRWLRERIANDWEVGQKIPIETELMDELGVGRGSVREAVKALVSSGLLEIRRGEGTFVVSRSEASAVLGRRLSVSDLIYVHQVRESIEMSAARLACKERTDADLVALREAAAVRESVIHGHVDHRVEFLEADLAFHALVVQASHNPVMSDIFDAILSAISTSYLEFDNSPPARLSSPAHLAVIDALEARDEEAVAVAVAEYLDHAPRDVVTSN